VGKGRRMESHRCINQQVKWLWAPGSTEKMDEAPSSGTWQVIITSLDGRAKDTFPST
jgi:hypothetical protein